MTKIKTKFSLCIAIFFLWGALSFGQIDLATQKHLPKKLTRQIQPTEEPKVEESKIPEITAKPELFLFGSQLLHQAPGAEAFPVAGAIPAGYLLGPGDRIGIYLGGKAQEQFDVTISGDGNVYIPTVGIFNVQGLSLGEFQTVVDKKLQRFYSNYTLSTMLVNPKSVRVSVIGEIQSPGHYTLSALNTVLDAVLRARAIVEKASLRDIQLYRTQALFMHIDLYDFLLKPGTFKDIYLQNGDQIFVPIQSGRVVVTGEVNREAIYETCPQKTERLSDMIRLAGGLTDVACSGKIELSRLEADGNRSVRLIDYTTVVEDTSGVADCIVQNNDKIHVYSLLEQIPEQIVRILGEVKNPGAYLLEQNMRVSDLILRAGSLTRSAYMLQAEVAKVDPKKPAKSIRVDLGKIMDGSDSTQDIILETDDFVFIRRIPEWEVGPVVTLRGEFTFPGMYTIIKDSTTLSDIVLQAGGLTEDAYVREAKLIRMGGPLIEDKEFERLKTMTRDEMSNLEYEYYVMKQNTSEMREIVVDFYKLLRSRDKSEDVILEDGDIVDIPKRPKVVLVSGCVARPGGIIFKENADLRYFIQKSGGYSWDANPKRTKVIKATGEIKDDEDVDSLMPGDRIWVPRKPDRNFWQIFRDVILTAGQIATIYLVIQSAVDRNK